MQNESDKVLTDRIQAGDAAAFEAMVIQYRPKLIASLVKYTKSVELSEDIAQQTFIKVWQKIDTFRGIAHYSHGSTELALILLKTPLILRV